MTDNTVKLADPAKWVWDAIQDPREQAVGIAEAMRAYATAAVMADRAERWRPIETAPRDGTRILLWERFTDYPVVGYWLNESWNAETESYEVSCGTWCYGGCVYDCIDPKQVTHWQPLPQPPAEDGE